MCEHGHDVINYIDDFLGFGTPSAAQLSFDALLDIMRQLGLTVSQKKLIPPSTKAVCLGILVDTVEATVSIPEEKLLNIRDMVDVYSTKKHCTKRVAISTLITPLYTQMCKTSLVFSQQNVGRPASHK